MAAINNNTFNGSKFVAADVVRSMGDLPIRTSRGGGVDLSHWALASSRFANERSIAMLRTIELE